MRRIGQSIIAGSPFLRHHRVGTASSPSPQNFSPLPSNPLSLTLPVPVRGSSRSGQCAFAEPWLLTVSPTICFGEGLWRRALLSASTAF